MAFIRENGTVISFAEFADVKARDSRVLESNESLTDDVVEPLLIRATERILSNLRATDWWINYWTKRSSTRLGSVLDVPALDPEFIRARLNDFTDLCVYTAMAEYILPSVADFGDEDNAERQKMGYYKTRSEELFRELVTFGDWYDFDDDSTIQSDEKEIGHINLRRIR